MPLPVGRTQDLAGAWAIGAFKNNVINLVVDGDVVKSKEERFGGNKEGVSANIVTIDGHVEARLPQCFQPDKII